MFGSALDKVAGYLDKRLVLTVLFPSLVFWSALLWLLMAHMGWAAALDWWSQLLGEQRVLLMVGAVAGIVFFASVLSVQIGPLTRLYEGYWGHRGPGRWLAAIGTSVQRRRHSRLDPADEYDFEVRYRSYPRRQSDLLPTRLGNVLKAAELYPSDDGRYGMDAVFFWPRLYAVLPDPLRTSLQEARSSLDLMLVSSALGLLFTAVTAMLVAVIGMGWRIWLITVASGALVTLMAYRGAVRAAITFGELVRTAFDLYRGTLLAQLGYRRPASLEEERRLWQNLGQQLYRRGASEPSILRSASPADLGPASVLGSAVDAADTAPPPLSG